MPEVETPTGLDYDEYLAHLALNAAVSQKRHP